MPGKCSSWLSFTVVLALALANANCADPAEFDEALQLEEADDGAFANSVRLRPRATESYTVFCDEWFSCDGTVYVAIPDDMAAGLFADAEEQARENGSRPGWYEEPLFTLSLKERGSEGDPHQISVTARVEVVEDEDGELYGYWLEYKKTTETLSTTSADSVLGFGFRSDDADAVFEFEIRNDRRDATLALGVGAEWQ